MKIIRQLVPMLALPLCLIASVLAAAPWLRSFPVSVAGAPLYGAAVLSVLVPIAMARFRPTWLWAGIAVDVVVFVFYGLFVVLQDPVNVSGFVQGLYRGPSQVLTFALPLVSPRSLMLAPVALTWVCGALAGECFARRWYTLLPYLGFLVAFGLAYAATQRAAGSELVTARHRETILAALLLVTLMLMRVGQAWVRQDESAQSTQPDGILPLRGLVTGMVTTLVIALAAALVVQSNAFPKHSSAPQRVPSVNDSKPLTPMSFIAGLRPRSGKDAAQSVFTVNIDKPAAGYFPIANVDFYDGSGWSFDRTFRPSGGVLPADTDTALATTRTVTQQYKIDSGPLTDSPWMPFLYRPERVAGLSVNIDPASGMIVPAGKLTGGESYTVRSGIANDTFAHIRARLSSADTGASSVDTQLPGGLRTTLDELVTTFSAETKVSSSPALPFLQALEKDLRNNYTLSRAAQGSANSTSTPSPSSTPVSSAPSSTAHSKHGKRDAQVRPLGAKSPKHRPHHSAPAGRHSTSAPPKTSASPSAAPSPSDTGPAADLAGGASFADVLASILGGRTGTPEQYATLVALVARDIGIPARVVTGFRVESGGSADDLPAGQYDVTTADAWSWTEIPVLGSGWVILDSSPSRYAPGNQQTESAASSPPTSSAPPTRNALVTQSSGGHDVAPNSAVPARATTSRHGLLVALLVVLGIALILLLLVLAARKPLRASRRRRAPDPRLRIIGAWRETIDVLTESGLPELTTLTSAEIVTLTDEQFGVETGRAAATLGAAANAVAYSAATAVEQTDADAAWRQHRALRRAVRRKLGLRDRVAANVRYHRPKRTPPPVSPPSWADAATAREQAANKPTGRHRSGRRRAH
ncbi:MAG TPA: transglutaminase domain-containing protein [Jatrophihabitantaceae bacterium]|nr:transglutaminase domain-containing protein [Jatrophihabitantaceae bacterium]